MVDRQGGMVDGRPCGGRQLRLTASRPSIAVKTGISMPALNIKNEEAYRLVRELAELKGKSMTTVVIEAVRAELERERGHQYPEGLAEKLVELGRQASPLWREPWRSTPHGDLLYDENGLPK
jgi:antitoxin VapB